MSVEFLPLEVDFESLLVDAGHLVAVLGPLSVNLSFGGELRLLSLKIGLLKLIVSLWE